PVGFQLHQVPDRRGGPPTCQRLQVAAEDDEGDQQRRRFEERGALAAETGVREEGVNDGDEVSGADARGVEQVHVRYAADTTGSRYSTLTLSVAGFTPTERTPGIFRSGPPMLMSQWPGVMPSTRRSSRAAGTS